MPSTRWEQRLAAPTVSFPQWSPRAPQQLFFTSDDDGSTQLWTLNVTTGERRRLTDQDVGVEEFVVAVDGSGVAWWCDDTGDEAGAWVVTDLTGGTRPVVTGVPDGWSQGLAVAPGRAAVVVALPDRYSLWLQDHGDAVAREVLATTYPIGLGREWETTPGGLSTDGALLCLRQADGGDMLHFGLQVLRAEDAGVVADLRDNGLNLRVASWSPIPGDQRLAVVHEKDGVERPTLWSPESRSRTDYPLDLPGPVDVLGWWPDGGSLLLVHRWRGRDVLHRLELESGALTWSHDADGTVTGAAVRPDGEVWLRAESAQRAARVTTTTGRIVLEPLGGLAQPGRAHETFLAPTPDGPAHMLFVRPAGRPPYPTVMLVHGGPEWHDSDELDPWEQALVDHGMAVAKVNYRGSTGATVAWRTAIHNGNIGFPEVADVVAAANLLVERGLADPIRLGIEGASWGGYVTLLAIGLHPTMFAAAVAVVPVADSLVTHEDCSPPQRDYDLAIMGGSPDQVRDRYVERSPITYVDRVRAPLLVIAGEFDSACPIRQVRRYVDRLEARGSEVDLVVYRAGHHANEVDDRLQHARLKLRFLQRMLLS